VSVCAGTVHTWKFLTEGEWDVVTGRTIPGKDELEQSHFGAL